MLRTPFWFKLLKPLLRPGRIFFKPMRRVYRQYKKTIETNTYNVWATQNEEECFVTNLQNDNLLISIVVPVFNPNPTHLLSLTYSIINQHYQNWELILVDASTKEQAKMQTQRCKDIDNRIKIVTPQNNLGIAGNTNLGLEAAKGEFVAFVDHDDLLHACALHSVAQYIQSNDSELIYTDEDKVDQDGLFFFDPHCKPRWSPDLLRNVNYINHLTVIKTEYLKKVGGLRKELDGAQDYDLLLRIIDICKPKISHVPQVLYHWRAAATSTASDIGNKTYIFKAGQRAVQEHLKRNNLKADAKSMQNRPGWIEVKFKSYEKYSLIVGPVEKHRERLCAMWVEKLLNTQGNLNLEVVIGEWFKDYAERLDINSVKYIGQIRTKGEYWQEAIKKCSNDIMVCFQEAAFPLHDSSLEQLAAIVANQPDTIVSPVIINHNNVILDAGLVESSYGYQRLFNGYGLGESTFFGSTEWVRNVASQTLDIFALNKETFKKCIKLDHNNKLCASYLSRPDGYRFIIWTHNPFVYNGMLSPRPVTDDYFNKQLSWASYEIHMKVSSWGDYNERPDES